MKPTSRFPGFAYLKSFLAPIASFVVVGLFQQASAQDDVRKQLEEIRASLQRVKSGLNQMGTPAPAPALRPVNPPVVPTPTPVVPAPPPVSPIPPKPAITKVEIVQTPSGSDANASNAGTVLEGVSLPPGLPRNYFIPFVALSIPMEGEWTSPDSPVTADLEEETGFTAGIRVGREFSWGLLEFELKGFRNSYRNLIVPTGMGTFSESVTGSSSGVSMLGNVGGRLALTERSSLFAGLGLGMAYIDSSFEIKGEKPKGDSDPVFAYQAFLGFEHAFSQSMEAFLRYKFFGTTDLDHFSGRRLHELELGLGFLF